jgi:AcrR family transcriptional regulator
MTVTNMSQNQDSDQYDGRFAMSPGRQTRTLSRERILQAAVRLVDEQGLEALSMRRLGQELGVQAMSLYNHVPSKAALLYGILERVLSEMNPLYGPDADWRERLRAGMGAFRQVGLAHPRVFALNTRPWPGAASQRAKEDMQTLSDAGFPPKQSVFAFYALVSYVVGFVSRETATLMRDPAELSEGLLAVPLELVAARQELHDKFASVAADNDEAFELGLEAMLDGLELLRRRSET